jgi:hypothetical protein
MSKKKRHHYVPISYLKSFCAEDGMLRVYRKDAPDAPHRAAPSEVAFRKYYYAQALPGGDRDTNRIEDTFSELEGHWPSIVESLARRANVNSSLEHIFQFVALQRARVPAAREAAERMLAATVMSTARRLEANGEFPPPPAGITSILDFAEVSIDPQMSIQAMVVAIQAMGPIFDRVGLTALHNTTDVELVTCDNPVIFFDETAPSQSMRPYSINASSSVALYMPVSPTVVLFGASKDKRRFAHEGLTHKELTDQNTVSMINELVVRFSYSAIFARSVPNEDQIRKHSALSPVLKVDRIPASGSEYLLFSSEFGPRERLPKWKPK